MTVNLVRHCHARIWMLALGIDRKNVGDQTMDVIQRVIVMLEKRVLSLRAW